MENMDKITMELLSNKSQYKKYLSKEDPAKYREHQEYLQKIKKNKHRILGYVKDFLENPEKDFNLEMNEMFSLFAKASIKYCFMKDLEKRGGCYEKDDSDTDDDVMFSREGDQGEGEEDQGEGEEDQGEDQGDQGDQSNSYKKNSYWGSQIIKQKPTMDSFFFKR